MDLGHVAPAPESAWIDVTVPISDGMVHWPDNPPVRVELAQSLERGDPATVSRLNLGSHTGTHVDAPGHFILHAPGVDDLPLERLMGPARVIAVAGSPAIGAAELRRHELRAGERIILRTPNTPRVWATDRFVPDYAYLSYEGARHLVDRGIWTVGIDYLSIGGGTEGVITHRALLQAGVVIIEGLQLARVSPGPYDLLCLPLRIRHGDGAPARVLLRSRQ